MEQHLGVVRRDKMNVGREEQKESLGVVRRDKMKVGRVEWE